jgi:hypothetical protein
MPDDATKPPLFSIIVAHYQGQETHEIFTRGINSILSQTFSDFEILCYHDGPFLDPSRIYPVPVTCTDKRFKDWGHSLQNLGIHAARGEYILCFAADNVLYPNALEEIAKEIRRPPRLYDLNGNPQDTSDIIIFPIKMHGLIRFKRHTTQLKDDQSFYVIFTGYPPVLRNIDAMQLVMRRELWLKEGGWTELGEMGDGIMYQKFCEKYGYRHVGPVLGEHY